MIEISLLRVFSVRENIQKYLKYVNTKTLSIQSIELLKDYKMYFEAHKIDIIDFGVFSTYFFIVLHPNLDEKSVLVYKEIINKVQIIPLEGLNCTEIITSFEQQELYNMLHDDLDKNIPAKELSQKLIVFCDKADSLKTTKEDLQDDMDLKKALVYTDRSKGLKWRLNCLNELFNGGLIKGDFGIVAGYVDMGKTGFLCSEISYMAQQLEGDQWIAWLNTEGNWEQILPRIYQATFECTYKDLTEKPEKAIEAYKERMKGNKNRIKVLNYQRKSIEDVENLIKESTPSLIVFDMLDALRGFERYMGKEGNSTARYEQLYQWAREISCLHCPVLAMSQLNGEGNNEPYPSITNLKGSRVDKQGAATFQLIIGGMEGNSTERYLSMPKNKVSSNKGWRQPVKFDPIRCRFKD